ncbi:MAG: tripartite tricarboxylate transporter substrate binding protein [Thermodesulfobacteriota bacterium]
MKRSLVMNLLFWMVIVSFAAGSTAWAQSYPSRPVNLILPGTPGSIIDITGRMLGDELGKILGQQFVPMNKPGGAFTVGTDFVAKSKKDGYTLSYTNNPAIVYARVLTPDTLTYDPDKDLEPLGLHLFFAHTVAVQESAPWKTFKELLEYAKKNPGKVNINTPGIGSTAHFHLEIIQSLTGTQFNHVPFKSGEAVITGLLGGHVDATFDAVSKLRPHMESGKVRMLLVSIKVPDLPKVPTLAELGYGQQQLVPSWFGMYGPAGLPEDVKKVLIPAIEKAVKNPQLKAKIEKLDFIVQYRTPAEQKKLATEEYKSALEIAKRLGLGKK